MKTLWSISILLIGAIAFAEPISIENVHIVPMDSEGIIEENVSCANGIFTSLSSAEPADGTTIIDGEGGYLIPALGDMHIHFFGGSKGLDTLLRLYLSQGIGYGLCMKGSRSLLKTRDAVAAGELDGPTLAITSPIIGNFQPYPPTYEKGVEIAKEYKEMGYDFLKVYNAIPAEGYQGILGASKEVGIPVVGHAVRSVMIQGAIDNGQHIAHVEEFIYGYFQDGLDESRIPELASKLRAANISVVTTLIAYRNIFLQVEDLEGMLQNPGIDMLPDATRKVWARDKNDYVARFTIEDCKNRLRPEYEFMKKIVKGLHDEGVQLVAGTDAMIPLVVPGYSLHTELAELVECGLTPYEALRTATVNVANFLDRTDCGTIEVGKEASAILLAENPLDDITHTQTIRGVLMRGQWYGPEALKAMTTPSSE